MVKKVRESKASDNERAFYSDLVMRLAKRLEVLSRVIADADGPELKRMVDLAKKVQFALDGVEFTRMARCRLLEAIDEAVQWERGMRRLSEDPSADADRRLKAANAQRMERLILDVREAFPFPGYTDRLSDEDLRIAIEVWKNCGAPPKGKRLPNKWEYLRAMLDRAGLGGIKTLEQDWYKWVQETKAKSSRNDEVI